VGDPLFLSRTRPSAGALWRGQTGDDLQMKQRFFRMGDGRIHIRNVHTGREVNAGLLAQDGSVDQEALAALDQVFRLTGNGEGEHISLRLLSCSTTFLTRWLPAG